MAPQPVAGMTVIWVASLGVAINGLTALALFRGGHKDLNVASAMAHALGDAGVSLGVAVAGALILATGWLWLDPAMSLAVSAVIVVGTWSLLRRALAMALDAVPHGIDPRAVRDHLKHLSGVTAVHDLHIWPMSTTETALTAHLVMPLGHPGDAALARFSAELDTRFAIGHATFQVETGEQECPLEPDHVV
jgi:cobalt-zinc-cadmium efflux system protein